jgi:hypothetical protein
MYGLMRGKDVAGTRKLDFFFALDSEKVARGHKCFGGKFCGSGVV